MGKWNKKWLIANISVQYILLWQMQLLTKSINILKREIPEILMRDIEIVHKYWLRQFSTVSKKTV